MGAQDGGIWAPSCPPLAWSETRGGERKKYLNLPAGHASLVLAGGPRASWRVGCTQTLQQAANWRVCSPPPSLGLWGPPCSFTGTAWCFNTIYGVGVSMAAERVGESPCPTLGRGEQPPRPGQPPPCPPSVGGVPGGVQRPDSLLPANLFALRLPPLSPPSLLQEEIQQLKSKLEKVEKERNELRLNSDRLESRVGPCQCRDGVWCCAGLPQHLPHCPVPIPPSPRLQS